MKTMDFPYESKLSEELIRFPAILVNPENQTGSASNAAYPNQNAATTKPVSNYIHKKCLICNNKFFYSRKECLDEWTEICWGFRRSFKVSECYEASHFQNTVPFCDRCKRELKKLMAVHKKLENLEVELKKLEVSIATTIVKSFSREDSEGPNYELQKCFYDQWHSIDLSDANFKRQSTEIRPESAGKTVQKSILETNNQKAIPAEYVVHEPCNFDDFIDDDWPTSPLMTLSPIQSDNDLKVSEKVGSNRATRTSPRKKISDPLMIDSHEDASAVDDDDVRVESAVISDDDFVPDDANNDEDFEPEIKVREKGKRKPRPCELPGIPHPCHFCGKIYKLRKSLSRHIRMRHSLLPASRDFRCEFPDCGKAFYTRWALTKHQQTHDPNYYAQLKEAGQKFLCAHCGKSYRYKRGLDHHMDLEHEIGPDGVVRDIVKSKQKKRFPNHSEYPESGRCDICDKVFSPRYLDTHRMSFHKIGLQSFTCKICGDKMNYKSSLNFHMRKKHPQTLESSGIQNESEKAQNDEALMEKSDRPTSRRHRVATECHVKGPRPCQICGKPVTNMYSHLQTHQGLTERSAQCPKCGKLCKSRSQLKIHSLAHNEQRFEESEKKHVCPEPNCGKKFTWYNSYYLHLRRAHERKPPRSWKPDEDTLVVPQSLPCPYCSKIISSKGNLTKHIAYKHQKGKRLACTHPGCTRIYFDPGNLRKHIRTHLPENEKRIFKCDQCPLVLCRKDDLKRHVDQKHDPNKSSFEPALKPYHCPHCSNSGFKTKRNFELHRMSYCPVSRSVTTGPTEERPFFCDLCGNKAFVRNADYQKHLIKSHPESRPPPVQKVSSSKNGRRKLTSQPKAPRGKNRGVKKHLVNSSESESSADEFEGEDFERIDLQAIPKTTISLRTRPNRNPAIAKPSSPKSSAIPEHLSSFNFNMSLKIDRLEFKTEPPELESDEDESGTRVPVIRSYESLAYSDYTADSPAPTTRAALRRKTLPKNRLKKAVETVLGI